MTFLSSAAATLPCLQTCKTYNGGIAFHKVQAAIGNQRHLLWRDDAPAWVIAPLVTAVQASSVSAFLGLYMERMLR